MGTRRVWHTTSVRLIKIRLTGSQQVIEQEKAIEQAKQQPQPQGQVESIPADELEAMREHQQGMDYGMKRLRELGRL